jgi:hypothetical protein
MKTVREMIDTTEVEKDNAWELHESLETQIDILEALNNYDLADPILQQLECDNATDLIETLRDVCKGGANAGFAGFTYSADMLAFFRKNKEEIVDLVKEECGQYGDTGILEFIQQFNCLKDAHIDIDEIGAVVFGDSEDSQVVDALCWFALESLAFNVDR